MLLIFVSVCFLVISIYISTPALFKKNKLIGRFTKLMQLSQATAFHGIIHPTPIVRLGAWQHVARTKA